MNAVRWLINHFSFSASFPSISTSVTLWRNVEEHESIGKGLAAEFVKSEEEEVSVDDKSPVLSPPTAEAGESETREDAPSPLSAVQICTGKVTRYAPAPSSSSPDSTTVSVEGLYETLWQDGATLYFGESAYQNARILFEKISAESDQVARSAEVESKKRKIAEDEKEKEEEEEGADDDDSDDEDVADEGGEVKRIKFEGGVSSRIQNQGPKDTMLMRSKYSVPFETVLKWR